MTGLMRGKMVELDIVALELGDLTEAEWSPLNGLSYDPRSDALFVFTEPAGPVEYPIPQPRQIYVELGATGVSQVVVIDAQGRKYFVRLRAPLELPASNELVDEPEGPPAAP